MNDIFLNMNKLKREVNGLSASQLEKVIRTLNRKLESAKESEAKVESERVKKEAEVEKISQLLRESGLTVDDLGFGQQKAVKAPRSKGVKYPPKYKVITSEGDVLTWSGRGRPSSAYSEARNSGAQEVEI